MKARISKVRFLHTINGLAPMVAMVTLLTLTMWPGLLGEGVDRAQNDERVRQVGAKLSAIPFRLGDWVGTDEPLPAAALEILHASAVVSRQYANLRTGERARLAIVYCGDARDMLGHHPPVCYPSSGWISAIDPRDPALSQMTLTISDQAVVANLYRFQKADSSGFARQITILGFFVIPRTGITHDEKLLRAQSGSRSQSALGVGQVQVLLDGHPSQDFVEGVAKSLLESLPSGTFEMLLGDSADVEARIGISDRLDPDTSSVEGKEQNKSRQITLLDTQEYEDPQVRSGGAR